MTPADDLAREVLATPWFSELLERITVHGVYQDLSTIERTSAPEAISWNAALRGASALTGAAIEAAQDAALRVAQGCLTASDSNEAQRTAAAILLERLGNGPALTLAADRELVQAEAWQRAPAPLQLDVIRRRLELGIPTAGGTTISANPFQRQFWSSAIVADWLSVSAPTSAGKSFIVKRWFDERLANGQPFQGAYLVPTRALIDEVSAELKEHLGGSVPVFSIPWDDEIGQHPQEIYVVTQERLHLLQMRLSKFRPDLLFIDEAQKFADGQRGVLLQRVLDESVRRNPGIQVLFASPLSENPAVLLDGAPENAATEALISETITVNQNVLWADEAGHDTKVWKVQLVTGDTTIPVGTVDLAARPTSQRKRLSLVAAALGGSAGGNLVYVNGAADAEKVARDIAATLEGTVDLLAHQKILALQDLVRRTVHPQYGLIDTLSRGVGFHYGNMPLLIRAEIEQLFRDGVLRYLVCTSTLLEGVNLPCRNLFARGPQRGRNRPMTPADFWNLAGRAGRWGKEFQGNIVCIDASDSERWPTAPRRRVRQPLSRATDAVMRDVGPLVAYAQAGTPLELARQTPLLEAVFSFLAARNADDIPLSSLPGLQRLSDGDAAVLHDAVSNAMAAVAIPSDLFKRHPGISPISMQALLDYFADKPQPESLLLLPPESTKAAESYVRALGRCTKLLGAPFGTGGRTYVLAILIAQWMRGMPLAALIAQRINYFRQREDPPKVAKHIRDTMADVEEYGRFQAPKYLGCYADLLRFYLESTGRGKLAEAQPDVVKLLELGVSSDTETSLMTLGLSRMSAVELAKEVIHDNLGRDEALAWLRSSDLDQIDLPTLVRREIDEMLRSVSPAEST
jgi:hypothetical protein